MKASFHRQALRHLISWQNCLVVLAMLTIPILDWQFVQAQVRLTARGLQLSSSLPGQTSRYNLTVHYTTATTLGSVEFEFCQNDPFIATACTVPPGLDLTTATIINQTGETGFSIHPSSTANKLVLSRTPAAASAQLSTYELDPVTNPSATGTYYGRVRTFASDDASGPEIDRGGLAFSINPSFQVSTEVPPFLLFCTGIVITDHDCGTASGDMVDFGELSRTQTRSGTSQFVAVTNAENGYAVTVSGTTMTAGNETIPAVTNAVAVPGVSQFGLNLRANNIPAVGQEPAGAGIGVPFGNYSQTDRYSFASGDTVLASTGASDYQTFTASYIVNISSSQAPGFYASTLSYICLANF